MKFIATCIKSTATNLPAGYLDPRAGLTRESDFPLAEGGKYAIQAAAVINGYLWLYVIDDNELPYPMAYPAALFDWKTEPLPSDWALADHSGVGLSMIFIGPKLWADDRFFYDRLTNHDDDAFAAFDLMRVR